MTETVPTYITPVSLLTMSGDDIETLLDGIRERRLNAVRQYEDAQRAAKEAADQKSRAQLGKQAEMLAKALESAEKAIVRVEDRVMKVRALRLELGLD